MSTDKRPRWRVNEVSTIGHALCQPGTEVFYTPTLTDDDVTNGVGPNLSPLNDQAQAIVDEQKEDHPDKSKHAAKRARLRAAEADMDDDEIAAEKQKITDEPVSARQAKGDTRKPKSPAAKTEDKPKGPKLGKGPTVAEKLGVDGDEADKADEPAEDDDIG
ncbi:hypothetical protein UFOVP1324_7 [uncultured Caudovirales phage]|uniref:Uncharacterized protein n=1 Tax=uncultured Caudovirales phage TaxID=2100421 RepID=A0A6J5RMT3_9CAUD|nr:hypothetical protein UFOVP1324_7 [uncultured Caudovirales phage]